MQAFVPPTLPPDPPPELGARINILTELSTRWADSMASQPCSRIASASLYLYIRKEALLSSQIEETLSSFSDLLLFESDAEPGVPIDDVEEVSNYVAATQRGLRRIAGGVVECLDNFEHFLHDEKHQVPLPVEAGLLHLQFETIHSFLDGNGRLGDC